MVQKISMRIATPSLGAEIVTARHARTRQINAPLIPNCSGSWAHPIWEVGLVD